MKDENFIMFMGVKCDIPEKFIDKMKKKGLDPQKEFRSILELHNRILNGSKYYARV